MGDYATAVAERDTKEMQLSTQKMQAENRQLELLELAKANASKILLENGAWVEQYTNFQHKQADAYAAILHSLEGASDPFAALFELMNQAALKAHASDKVTLTM